jgi:hypothetical protein
LVDTGIDLNIGDEIGITATGQWRMSQGKNLDLSEADQPEMSLSLHVGEDNFLITETCGPRGNRWICP